MIAENKKTSSAGGVRELYTDDTVLALNAALAESGIDAGQVISVLPVPGQGMGQPVPPRFRVLYRAN